ncbi:MAG: N-acetylmuramoyl-L-alanine amidase [Fimbriimonas sp.]
MLAAISCALALVVPIQETPKPGQIVGYVPDPRIPMPNPWKEPGYLQIAWIQSPNYGQRPVGSQVDTIVVHSTVIESLERTTVAFQRTASQVSAHFTIGRDGGIVQNVSTFERAWHAGVSTDVAGRRNLNDFSIGIELVNLNDGKQEYPDAQLQALCGIIAQMRRRFPIKQIVSHEFIADPQGRKNDPKNFPWDRLKYFGLPLYYGPKAK